MMLSKTIVVVIFVWVVGATDKECDKNEDCTMSGSICKQNACICPPNTIANSLHTKCLAVSDGYGSQCEDNVQCSGGLKSGGICSNGTCICSQGYHYFLGECYKSAGLGEACRKDENCFVVSDFEAAKCSKNNLCVCSPGYYQREYTSCRRESYKPGDPCGVSLDCKFDNPVCNLNRTCETGKAGTNYDAKVLNGELELHGEPIIITLSSKIGESCKTSSDCPQNSECNDAKECRCQKGYYTVDNSTCFAELGAKCELDGDCVGKNTQCRNQTVCVCKQGYVTSANGRYCDKMARDIAWSCLRDEQCGLFGPRSLCIKKKCDCNEESHYIKDKMYCWIRKLVGENCTENQDCGSAKGVACQNGKCQCSENFHPSSNKTDCRENSYKVGDACAENLDCLFSSSFCDTAKNGTCNCLNGYIVSDGKCLPGIGGNCTGNDQCKAEGSTCVNNTCTCKKDFISNSDFSKCLPVTNNINGSCSEDSQCSKLEGVCTKGFCSCLNGSHFIDYSCIISRKLNESCTQAENCTYIPHARCYENFCHCLPGYFDDLRTNMCSGVPYRFNDIPVLGILTSCWILRKIIGAMISS